MCVCVQPLKALEIEDSDDEEGAREETATPTTMGEGGGDVNPEAGRFDEDGCAYVWDSSSSTAARGGKTHHRRCGHVVSPSTTVELGILNEAGDAAVQLKEQGNAFFGQGAFHTALVKYTQAIQICMKSKGSASSEEEEGKWNEILAVLYSNISATALKINKANAAVEAAVRASSFLPEWRKPYKRLAEAYLELRNFAAAAAACKKGETCCTVSSDGRTEFTGLYDRIAVLAGASGQDYVYSGRRLEVRNAGDEAWLGKPAPYVPELDGPLDESNALPSDDLSEISSGGDKAAVAMLDDRQSAQLTARQDSLAQWNYANTSLAIQSQRTSFRCLKEAYKAARDGDRIVLQKGVHNGLGECLTVNKRILIEGEGGFGETIIDQRANVPTFKIVRGGVTIRNIDLDQTGFREAILIDGTKENIPLIEKCDIKYVSLISRCYLV